MLYFLAHLSFSEAAAAVSASWAGFLLREEGERVMAGAWFLLHPVYRQHPSLSHGCWGAPVPEWHLPWWTQGQHLREGSSLVASPSPLTSPSSLTHKHTLSSSSTELHLAGRCSQCSQCSPSDAFSSDEPGQLHTWCLEQPGISEPAAAQRSSQQLPHEARLRAAAECTWIWGNEHRAGQTSRITITAGKELWDHLVQPPTHPRHTR